MFYAWAQLAFQISRFSATLNFDNLCLLFLLDDVLLQNLNSMVSYLNHLQQIVGFIVADFWLAVSQVFVKHILEVERFAPLRNLLKHLSLYDGAYVNVLQFIMALMYAHYLAFIIL